MRAALVFVLLAPWGCAHGPTHAARWQQFAEAGPRALPALGATLEVVQPRAGPKEEGRLVLLRAAPDARLQAFAVAGSQASLSAERWSARLQAPHALWNAGFYGSQGQHVGLLKAEGQWRQRQRQADWCGLLFSHPNRPDLPSWQLVDLEARELSEEGLNMRMEAYDTVVQSMVLFDAHGRVRTRPSAQAAARTALGVDTAGRLVVALTEGAWTLADFAQALQSLPSPLVWAINLDGGLESQLAVRSEDAAPVSLTSRHGSHGAIPEEWTARMSSRPLPAVLVLLPADLPPVAADRAAADRAR